MKWFKRLIQGKIDEVKDWQDPDREETPTPCPEITLPGIPQELYDKLLSEAHAAGAFFEGTKAQFKGCVFDWNYDAASQTLHVTCLSKPFIFSCGEVEQHIRELVKGAQDVVG